MKITLNLINEELRTCSDGFSYCLAKAQPIFPDRDWTTLLNYLGKTTPDDEPLSLKTILKANGMLCACLCLRVVDGFDKEKRLFAVNCAKQLKHLMKDQDCLNALKVSERYANGLATDNELDFARSKVLKSASCTMAAIDTYLNRMASGVANEDAEIAASATINEFSFVFGVPNINININDIKKRIFKNFIRMINCIENGEVYKI